MGGRRRPTAMLVALALAAIPTSVSAQFGVLGGKNAGAQVLVLGSYHMSNPGLDVVNLTADDVLAPKRQRAIRSK